MAPGGGRLQLFTIGSELRERRKTVETNPTHFKVDSETINDLTQVGDALTKHLQWLMKKKDLEAANKLIPIVNRMTDLMCAILEGKYPEMGGTFDAINRLGDELNERLAQATTREEIDHLSNEVDKVWKDIQEARDKGLAEITKQEETAIKDRKH
jgi:hypothetical protein